MMVEIRSKQCVGCMACVRDCPVGNLVLRDGRAVPLNDCMLCGHCVSICPQLAVSIPAYEMSDVEEYDKADFSLDSEHLLRAIKFRRSVRNYKNLPLGQDVLEKIIQAGRYTATARNSQGCRFIVVQRELPAFKSLIWDAIGNALDHPDKAAANEARAGRSVEAFREFYQQYIKNPEIDRLFCNAPAVLYIASDTILDAGLAAQNMEMMAVSLGLGMLYNGYLRAAAAMFPCAVDFLGAGEKPLAACMLLGYPAVSYLRTAPRRRADVICR